MKKLTLILSLFLLANLTIAQTNCDIVDSYGAFIVAEKFTHKGNTYLTKKAQALDEGHCLASIINPNLKYVNYLITNFSSHQKNQDLVAISDSLEFQQKFIERIQLDSAFNKVMTQYIEGVNNDQKKETYTTDEVMNIAIKYFSITGIRNGNYEAKVCAGINGIRSTEAYRDPQLEAFCFSAILNAVATPNSDLMNSFVKGVRQLYTMSLGVNEKEEVLRAQGAVFFMMKNSPELKKVIRDSYQQHQAILPFIWTEE